MLLNDMKEELKRFAESYCLVFRFKEDRDMLHSDIYPIAVCENITYIFAFINPRTGYKHTFEINHTDAINIGDEIVRAIKDNIRRDLQLVDRMKKPQWIGTALGTEAEQKITYSEQWKKTREEFMKPRIANVIFNRPATIVFWSDGTKTVVQAQDEAFDEEKGLAMAIAKKFLGNQGNYFEEFKKWLSKKNSKPVVKEVYLTVKEFAKISGQGLTTVRKDCARGLHPGAKKVDGKWLIPYEGMVKKGE